MRGVNHMLVQALAGQNAIHNKPVVNAALATDVVPGVVPTGPSPGQIFKEGGDCTITWTPDPSGQWKQTDVELMSGDNFNMLFITTVTTFDGTDTKTTSFTYPCPDVEPNAAIYFYQFSTPAAPANLTWTGRFAIAAADGTTTAPANATQPNGDAKPWGVGVLADPSKASAAPSYLTVNPASPASSSSSSSSAPVSTSSSTTSSASVSSSSSGAQVSTTSSRASTTNAGGVVSTESSAGTATVTSTSSSGSASPTNASGGNGALGVSARASFGAAALAMAGTAAVFALMS